nr:hypothetical protein [Oceanococcus sp. HetDA_MAG_MS8]
MAENILVALLFVFWGGAVVLAPFEMKLRRELLRLIQRYDEALWKRLGSPHKGNLESLYAEYLMIAYCVRPQHQTQSVELSNSSPMLSRCVVITVKLFIALGFFSGVLLVMYKEGVLN